VLLKRACIVWLAMVLAACSQMPQQSYEAQVGEHFQYFPNWYHHNVGHQLYGHNEYVSTAQGALIRQADTAFFEDNWQACQIFLERAQRIAPRDPAIYVRLSYLYWVQMEKPLAIQTARRALSVVGSDAMAKDEILRLLAVIEQN